MKCSIYVTTVIYYFGGGDVPVSVTTSLWLDRKDAEQICASTPQYDGNCVCSYVEVLP